jgi:hypothetical protein
MSCYVFRGDPLKSRGDPVTCGNDMYEVFLYNGYMVSHIKEEYSQPSLFEFFFMRKHDHMGLEGLETIVKLFEDNGCRVVGIRFLFPSCSFIQVKYYFEKSNQSFTRGIQFYDRVAQNGFPIRSIRVGSNPDEFKIKFGSKDEKWNGLCEYACNQITKAFSETGYTIDQNFEDINTTGVLYRPNICQLQANMDVLKIE